MRRYLLKSGAMIRVGMSVAYLERPAVIRTGSDFFRTANSPCRSTACLQMKNVIDKVVELPSRNNPHAKPDGWMPLEFYRLVRKHCVAHVAKGEQVPTDKYHWIVQDTRCTAVGRGYQDTRVLAIEAAEKWIESRPAELATCICTRDCDCASPDGGSASMECPIHNDSPQPHPDCAAEKHHWELHVS